MKFFNTLVAITLLLSGVVYADTPAVHGMLLFGNSQTYASHLPMFHAPHDYQFLMQLKLSDVSGAQTLAAYQNAKNRGDSLFTLVPEVLDLTALISGVRTGFSASLYLGHFEQGGIKLGQVTAQIQKIIYSAKLNGDQPPSASDDYLVFGANGEYFSAHIIKEKPSFDFVASVGQAYHLQVHSCRTRVCADPTKVAIPDAALPTTVSQMRNSQSFAIPSEGGSIGDLGGNLTDVQKVIYSEVEELSH